MTEIRRKRQPSADTMRTLLRNAADTIEAQGARLRWWEEHFEQALAQAVRHDPRPLGLMLLAGFLLGAACVALWEVW